MFFESSDGRGKCAAAATSNEFYVGFRQSNIAHLHLTPFLSLLWYCCLLVLGTLVSGKNGLKQLPLLNAAQPVGEQCICVGFIVLICSGSGLTQFLTVFSCFELAANPL